MSIKFIMAFAKWPAEVNAVITAPLKRAVFPILPCVIVTLAAFLVAPAYSDDLRGAFSIAPPPAWVQSEPVEALSAHAEDEKAGIAYLLIDRQTNVASEELFTRIVREVRTAQGVQDGSSVMASFDPSYQKLTFHHILVYRGGVAHSRLSQKSVQILRREPSLEAQIIDGSVTASIFLEDVRPGDRINFAFTIRGRNSVLAKRYVDEFPCGWPLPVSMARVRILCPHNRALKYRILGDTEEPAIRTKADTVEYIWVFANTPAVIAEDQTPPWYATTPWLQVSEFSDWTEVSSWASSLYPSADFPIELRNLIDSWRKKRGGAKEQAIAALEWIQQNIRYVGIELGVGSYKPSPPILVVNRRFGDCKDQSYLLCTFLKQLGIEAKPVLVNTWARKLVGDMLPSPYAFNHVLTRLTIGGKSYFVDPTQTYQRGPLKDRYMPDYGLGLVVADSQQGLISFGSHQGQAPEEEVQVRIRAHGPDEPAELEVQTISRGGTADRVRQLFAVISSGELARDYLNYRAARYPRIETVEDLRFEDDAVANVFHVYEQYRLPNFWVQQAEGARFQAEVFADAIIEALPKPMTKVRMTPLLVSYPHRVRQRIDIELPEAWPGKSEDHSFTSPAFELKIQRQHRGSSVSIHYDYRALASEIPPGDVLKVQQAIMDIDPELGYQISWAKTGMNQIGWTPAVVPLAVAMVSLALLAAAAAMLYRRALQPAGMPVTPVMDISNTRVQGLGGWLVLVGLALLIRPILSIIILGKLAPMLSAVAWHALASPNGSNYHPDWAVYLLFDLAVNLATVVACVILLVLFFQRRRLFPISYIVFLIGTAVFTIIEAVFSNLVPGNNTSITNQTLGVVISSVIWVMYMRRSQRVKLTFIL